MKPGRGDKNFLCHVLDWRWNFEKAAHRDYMMGGDEEKVGFGMNVTNVMERI
jgi:hypothetical protein